MTDKGPSKKIKISEINEKNIHVVENETINRVNKTVTALEAALATWDAAKEKPEDMKERFSYYRKLHDALILWEQKALKARDKKEKFEKRVSRLREFVDICYSYS